MYTPLIPPTLKEVIAALLEEREATVDYLDYVLEGVSSGDFIPYIVMRDIGDLFDIDPDYLTEIQRTEWYDQRHSGGVYHYI